MLVPNKETRENTVSIEELGEIGRARAVALTNYFFSESLQTFEDAKDFLAKLGSIEKAVDCIQHPDDFYFVETCPRKPTEQLQADMDVTLSEVSLDLAPPEFHGPGYILWKFVGRSMQTDDILITSTASHMHPLVPAEVSFHWLALNARLLEERVLSELGETRVSDFTATNALLAEDLRWLANLGTDDLVALRRQGALGDIRSLFSREIQRLASVGVHEARDVARAVDASIAAGLRKHQDEIATKRGSLVRSLAISGTGLLASLVAAMQPILAPELPAWTEGAIALFGASANELTRTMVNYWRTKKAVRSSAMAILWRARIAGQSDDGSGASKAGA